jgi:membrane protein DedA with SNARE-associated domain
LERYRFTRRYAEKYLPRAERFFARHGGKAVFLGRFVAVLRVTAAWVAGISHMRWWRFLIWNAAGAVCWATLVGLVSYYLGDAAAGAIGKYGLYAAGGALLFAALGYLIVKRLERRIVEEDESTSSTEEPARKTSSTRTSSPSSNARSAKDGGSARTK